MVPEASLEQTDFGLVPAGEGWFVLNARTARWTHRPGRGQYPSLMGKGDFPQVAMGLNVLAPGEPMAMYHWETDQEDFLVLSGEALLIIEGEERPLRQWDFVHCPPGTNHVIVGPDSSPAPFSPLARWSITPRGRWSTAPCRGPRTGAPIR
jgi:quercetin dioxygenase-like cupin family protein